MIWQTRERLGREVALTEAGVAHMLVKHPEMLPRLDEIRAAVEDPTFSTRPAGYPHRECLYRNLPATRLRTKVVVNYRPVPPQGTWAGEVITAHRTARVGPEEDQIWP